MIAKASAHKVLLRVGKMSKKEAADAAQIYRHSVVLFDHEGQCSKQV
ncbi:hypothetical protein JCM19240_1490 [Vibrio maritimus]|uniref:Uncharacterized protein n=1 Tax=Vibrio maritimus TaxID=990268 RepID=A0A090T9X2_9VIBR|nr:hypothetical protein JCM19240_1490 [Vibrio maritimus]